jgi:hypothetical protein
VGVHQIGLEGSKRFFFEKKNQKTYIRLGPAERGHTRHRNNGQKFFASFFQKRRPSLTCVRSLP